MIETQWAASVSFREFVSRIGSSLAEVVFKNMLCLDELGYIEVTPKSTLGMVSLTGKTLYREETGRIPLATKGRRQLLNLWKKLPSRAALQQKKRGEQKRKKHKKRKKRKRP